MLGGARACFAQDGLDAQMDAIAARAGVGVGTVYRHFPTKDAVIRALVSEHLREQADEARATLEDPDPGAAFEAFLRRCAERQARDRALAQIMATRPELMREQALGSEELVEVVSVLMRRAQDAGRLRRDVSPADVPMLMCGLGRALEAGDPTRAPAWQRFLEIMLAGLRP